MLARVLTGLVFLCLAGFVQAQAADVPAPNPALQDLAAQFFEWRRVQQPVSNDEVARMERPAGWVPSWSPENLALYRARYRDYLERLGALDRSGFSRSDEVDAMLLTSAINRVGWELDVLRSPNRNPLFYLDQTLGSVLELLVLAPPVTPSRLEEILTRLRNFPVLVNQAETNLNDAAQPFAIAAIEQLMDIENVMSALQSGLAPLMPQDQLPGLEAAILAGRIALADYRDWLQRMVAEMDTDVAIGERAYQWYLVNIALIPYTPDELVLLGRQAWNQAVTLDALEENRDPDSPPLPVLESAQALVEAAARNEQEIRAFLDGQGLFTIPAGLPHYRILLRPPYLDALAFMGSTSDFTAAARLGEDAYGYIPAPADTLPFLAGLAARDPRLLIAHEGIPGHYFQWTMSWANADPIRRNFFDSAANEGIGFYAQELLLEAGLFTFSPQSRRLILALMRLRALQVEADIRLAKGEFTIDQAAGFLANAVPMDRMSAAEEAVQLATHPGQAIGYQIGKLQIEQFLADSKLAQGDTFSLRNFHDDLMRNGNVPVALQRWESLGMDEELVKMRSLDTRTATVPD